MHRIEIAIQRLHLTIVMKEDPRELMNAVCTAGLNAKTVTQETCLKTASYVHTTMGIARVIPAALLTTSG